MWRVWARAVLGRWSFALGRSSRDLAFDPSQRPTTKGHWRLEWYVQNSVNGPYDKSNPAVVYCFKVACKQEKPHVAEQWKFDQLAPETGLAEMLKGGVIMDVTNAEQAVIAEKAGAVSVMALERVPAQIRAEGGVARMASPKKIREIMAAVSIPVMAKCRIGHFAEAQILQELGVDYIDESEVLTPADEAHHVDKHAFKVPFVCGARNLGEALRRIAEGAAMIRTKGEAGTGDVVHAVKHMRQIVQEMRILTVLGEEELYAKAKEHQAPYELVRMVAKAGKLPVPNFSAGGIATPADAALVMQLGAESVFVGSGIFMQDSTTFADPEEAEKRAKAIVLAATHFNDPKVLLEVSEDLVGAMKGLAVSALDSAQMLQTRGW
jgi:pyridoxal 5'-phosphate synthase pdxS subunit